MDDGREYFDEDCPERSIDCSGFDRPVLFVTYFAPPGDESLWVKFGSSQAQLLPPIEDGKEYILAAPLDAARFDIVWDGQGIPPLPPWIENMRCEDLETVTDRRIAMDSEVEALLDDIDGWVVDNSCASNALAARPLFAQDVLPLHYDCSGESTRLTFRYKARLADGETLEFCSYDSYGSPEDADCTELLDTDEMYQDITDAAVMMRADYDYEWRIKGAASSEPRVWVDEIDCLN